MTGVEDLKRLLQHEFRARGLENRTVSTVIDSYWIRKLITEWEAVPQKPQPPKKKTVQKRDT